MSAHAQQQHSAVLITDHGADRTIVAACLPSRWVGGCTQLAGDQGLRARPLVRFSLGSPTRQGLFGFTPKAPQSNLRRAKHF